MKIVGATGFRGLCSGLGGLWSLKWAWQIFGGRGKLLGQSIGIDS